MFSGIVKRYELKIEALQTLLVRHTVKSFHKLIISLIAGLSPLRGSLLIVQAKKQNAHLSKSSMASNQFTSPDQNNLCPLFQRQSPLRF